MRLSFIFAVLAVLSPSALFGAGTRVSVRVVAQVPLVAAVEGPEQVVLSPGEVTQIRVRVLANVAWILSIQSPNAAALEPAQQSGQPGGADVNSRDVEITCSSQASGPQTIALVYTLMPR
jgi:hypothetical protein